MSGTIHDLYKTLTGVHDAATVDTVLGQFLYRR